MWLRDTGMLDKIKWKKKERDVYIPDPKVRVGEPLHISELGTAIFLEIGGVFIAILAFFVELCCSARFVGKDRTKVGKTEGKQYGGRQLGKYFQREQRSETENGNTGHANGFPSGDVARRTLIVGNHVVDLPVTVE